jgi:predicted nucleic acid-binding protein
VAIQHLRPYYLGDTSALARRGKPRVAERLDPLLVAGLVARCTPTDLEAGYSARSPADFRRLREERAAWPFVAIDQEVLDRAFEVQGVLAGRAEHRSVPIADLIIAAAAAAAGLVVLHYDRDFERIAEVTGQPVEWVVPAGRAD